MLGDGAQGVPTMEDHKKRFQSFYSDGSVGAHGPLCFDFSWFGISRLWFSRSVDKIPLPKKFKALSLEWSGTPGWI